MHNTLQKSIIFNIITDFDNLYFRACQNISFVVHFNHLSWKIFCHPVSQKQSSLKHLYKLLNLTSTQQSRLEISDYNLFTAYMDSLYLFVI